MSEEILETEEREAAFEVIEGMIKNSQERFFDSPFLEKTHKEAENSLYEEGEDPRDVVSETEKKINKFNTSLQFLWGLPEEFPKRFPEETYEELEKLSEVESLEKLKETTADIHRKVSQFLPKPDVEKIDLSIDIEGGEISNTVDPVGYSTPSQEGYERRGREIEYMVSTKKRLF